MTAAERDEFEQGILADGKADLRNVRAKLAAICCVDTDGKSLFSAADIDRLGQMRASVLDKLAAAARRLSGMEDSDEDAEKKG